MPLDDPRQIRSLEDAFDLTTPEIQLWELGLIWRAVDEGLVRFDLHATMAAYDESITTTDILGVILRGTPRSKDTGRVGRRSGINFEGKVAGGRMIRTKLSWLFWYVIVTVHTIG